MEKGELHNKLFKCEMEGYILGLNRSEKGQKNLVVSHIYKGTFHDPEKPMCPKGYNRGADGWSIWRNNIGKGICQVCLRNTLKELSLYEQTK